MSYKLKQKGPRCECCDEILDEVFTMRQRFEKLMHQLNAQIVELRREVRSLTGSKIGKLSAKHNTNKSKQTQKFKAKSNTNYSLEDEFPRKKLCPTKIEAINVVTSDEDNTAVVSTPSENSNNQFADDLIDVKPTIRVRVKQTAKREFMNYTLLEPHIIPKMPFICPEEFEEWDQQFITDADKKDKLRVELSQGYYEEPDKFIKHIWKSIMTDDAANGYSLRGNTRTHKKAIYAYNFTEIFKECFLQRFENLDEDFFLERTMRFFNYAQDRTRRIFRLSTQPQPMHDFDNVHFKESSDDEPSMEEPIEHVYL